MHIFNALALICLSCWHIVPVVSAVEPFAAEYAYFPVQGENEKWGYISRSGHWVVRAVFDYAGSFSVSGLAQIRQDGMSMFINRKGNIQIDAYDACHPFSDGFAAVRKSKFWGFIDTSGQVRIPFQFESVFWFRDGFTMATLDGIRWGLIDKTGDFVIEPSFLLDDIWHPIGLAGGIAFKHEEKWGILLADGGVVFNPLSETRIDMFAHNRAAVTIDGKFGYIDTAGRIVIDCQFDAARAFSEGMAAVSISNHWGFIDQLGKLVIPATFDDAGNYSEGLASVSKDNKWGYIDKGGNEVIDLSYDAASPFHDDVAVVEIGDYAGCINRMGEVIIPPIFASISDFAGGVAYAYRKERKLSVSKNFPFIRVAIFYKSGYIDQAGKWIFCQREALE
jgi:hypothetical protein